MTNLKLDARNMTGQIVHCFQFTNSTDQIWDQTLESPDTRTLLSVGAEDFLQFTLNRSSSNTQYSLTEIVVDLTNLGDKGVVIDNDSGLRNATQTEETTGPAPKTVVRLGQESVFVPAGTTIRLIVVDGTVIDIQEEPEE
ncbi:hypothetical protein [Pseudomonas putida]